MPSENAKGLLASLKKAARALRDADIPFALGGGIACWAFGAPASEHDVDLMVRPEDVERAQQVLVDAGMRPERPAEDWLLKVYDGDNLIDLIFRPSGLLITDDVLARCPERGVEAMQMHVLPLDDVLTTKLLALNERNLDLEPLVQISRAVREQVDWTDVWGRTRHSPFARTLFTLLDELGIVPSAQAKAG